MREVADERARAFQALDAVLPLRPEHEPVVGLQLHRGAMIVHVLDEPLRVGELLMPEGYQRALRPRIHLRDARSAAIVLDLNHREQVLDLLRQRAEPVG